MADSFQSEPSRTAYASEYPRKVVPVLWLRMISLGARMVVSAVGWFVAAAAGSAVFGTLSRTNEWDQTALLVAGLGVVAGFTWPGATARQATRDQYDSTDRPPFWLLPALGLFLAVLAGSIVLAAQVVSVSAEDAADDVAQEMDILRANLIIEREVTSQLAAVVCSIAPSPSATCETDIGAAARRDAINRVSITTP